MSIKVQKSKDLLGMLLQLLLLHLALQPWGWGLGLLDNQYSVEFGRWESTAVRYSSLL
jgi:hypothetical protein